MIKKDAGNKNLSLPQPHLLKAMECTITIVTRAIGNPVVISVISVVNERRQKFFQRGELLPKIS